MSTERASAGWDHLAAIDAALMRLRRLWTTPRRRADLEQDVGAGVSLSQVLVVDAVARAEAGREVTVGSIADLLTINESTASRLVDRTVRAGFVERGRSQADSRRVVLTLTDDGRDLWERSLRHRLSYLDDLLDCWEPGERAQFATLLCRFADAVDDHPGAAGTRAD